MDAAVPFLAGVTALLFFAAVILHILAKAANRRGDLRRFRPFSRLKGICLSSGVICWILAGFLMLAAMSQSDH